MQKDLWFFLWWAGNEYMEVIQDESSFVATLTSKVGFTLDFEIFSFNGVFWNDELFSFQSYFNRSLIFQKWDVLITGSNSSVRSITSSLSSIYYSYFNHSKKVSRGSFQYPYSYLHPVMSTLAWPVDQKFSEFLHSPIFVTFHHFSTSHFSTSNPDSL